MFGEEKVGLEDVWNTRADLAAQLTQALEVVERLRAKTKEALTEIKMVHPQSKESRTHRDNAWCFLDEALAATEPAIVEPCTWTEDADGGCWNTACGKAWTLLEGTPEENGVKYCHHCGKPIKQVPFVYVDEDEDDATVELPKCDHCGAIACGTDCDGSSHYTPDEKE